MLTKVCQSSLGKIDGVAEISSEGNLDSYALHYDKELEGYKMKVSEVAIWQPRLPSCMLHSFDKAR